MNLCLREEFGSRWYQISALLKKTEMSNLLCVSEGTSYGLAAVRFHLAILCFHFSVLKVLTGFKGVNNMGFRGAGSISDSLMRTHPFMPAQVQNAEEWVS